MRGELADGAEDLPGVVGAAVGVDGCAHTEEVQLGEGGGFLRVGGEAQPPAGGVLREEFGQARLVDGALTGVEPVHLRVIGVHTDHLVADLCHGRCMGDTEVSTADHRNAHGSPWCERLSWRNQGGASMKLSALEQSELSLDRATVRTSGQQTPSGLERCSAAVSR